MNGSGDLGWVRVCWHQVGTTDRTLEISCYIGDFARRRGTSFFRFQTSRNVWRPEMVSESESNSWAVSGLPRRRYSSTGALADMRLASKRPIRTVSVSISISRLTRDRSPITSTLLSGLQTGPREFQSFSTLPDLLECEPIRHEHILHRGSQSTCLGGTSYRPIPHLFHTVFLDGDDAF